MKVTIIPKTTGMHIDSFVSHIIVYVTDAWNKTTRYPKSNKASTME